jgi:hypothetical protein
MADLSCNITLEAPLTVNIVLNAVGSGGYSTPATVRDALETLTTTDRLNADSVKSGAVNVFVTPAEKTLYGTDSICIACSDESTALTAGLAKVTFRMPFAMTLNAGNAGVRMNVNTAPTNATIIVNIKEGGTTILSTKCSINANEFTSVTATSQVVISDVNLAADAEITIDIDQVGSTIAGKGLKVYLIGTRL